MVWEMTSWLDLYSSSGLCTVVHFIGSG